MKTTDSTTDKSNFFKEFSYIRAQQWMLDHKKFSIQVIILTFFPLIFSLQIVVLYLSTIFFLKQFMTFRQPFILTWPNRVRMIREKNIFSSFTDVECHHCRSLFHLCCRNDKRILHYSFQEGNQWWESNSSFTINSPFIQRQYVHQVIHSSMVLMVSSSGSITSFDYSNSLILSSL